MGALKGLRFAKGIGEPLFGDVRNGQMWTVGMLGAQELAQDSGIKPIMNANDLLPSLHNRQPNIPMCLRLWWAKGQLKRLCRFSDANDVCHQFLWA